MNRITLLGAVFLALIAILPTMISRLLGVSQTISYFLWRNSLVNFGWSGIRYDEAS